MNAIERYARNFAKIVYHADNLECLDDTDRYQIHRIFDSFKPEYHAAIAEYPLWVLQNVTPRDGRRFEQYLREGIWPIFLFSHARIERYLRQVQKDGFSAS
jgi:hypothetical protein